MNDTAIVILAAGNSSRLGTPKQLLQFGNHLMIQSVVQAALDAKAAKVIVVTGANGEQVAAALHNTEVELIHNRDWQGGMASSIVTAVRHLSEKRDRVDSIILAVCDQPFISSGLFQKLFDAHKESHKGIIACSYGNTSGTPVFFHRRYFAELQKLKGSEGAKPLLKNHAGDLSLVDFPEGAIDIDTVEDYQNALLKMANERGG
jgi:molybdenum cofactor cytidylyltransferase